jgi:transposase
VKNRRDKNMKIKAIERLDHLGIIATVINDLGLTQSIDSLIQKDTLGQEHITPGEAIKGMILNGLGFTSKPLSLTPQFFENKPLNILIRPGVEAAHFNRHRLGDVLDLMADFGNEKLFSIVASFAANNAGVSKQFISLDTTSFSFEGEYKEASENEEDHEEKTISMRYGYSKDKRPDLKQLVLEMVVTQDGGVPLIVKTLSGNASDSVIFKERVKKIVSGLEKTKLPPYLIADSKLYCKETAEDLRHIYFITRIPRLNKEEQKIIQEALCQDKWHTLNAKNKFAVFNVKHYDIDQRWIVVHSDDAQEDAKRAVEKAIQKEEKELLACIKELAKKQFDCLVDAQTAAKAIFKKCAYHTLTSIESAEKSSYQSQGRPKKNLDLNHTIKSYSVMPSFEVDLAAKQADIDEKSCYVLGTNVPTQELSHEQVIEAYKNQNRTIENIGFRFMKDPLFFASSFFLKKPSRVESLLTIMALSLLVYSIAQRHMRKQLQKLNKTMPNQIKKQVSNPTLRWAFQLLEGINKVELQIAGHAQDIVQGIKEVQELIIRLFGLTAVTMYQLSENHEFSVGGCSM